MKKYELMKTGKNFWKLYFYNKEFNCYEFITGYDAKKTTIKEIYDFVKNNNKYNSDIIQVKFLNNNI